MYVPPMSDRRTGKNRTKGSHRELAFSVPVPESCSPSNYEKQGMPALSTEIGHVETRGSEHQCSDPFDFGESRWPVGLSGEQEVGPRLWPTARRRFGISRRGSNFEFELLFASHPPSLTQNIGAAGGRWHP